MKDETKYFPIVEIVRLMSKLYSYAKELLKKTRFLKK